MNRIRALIRDKSRPKLLVPFFTAGYPDIRITLDLVHASVDAGADIVELGVPFSDPVADGPAIQYSSQIALSNGINLKRILAAVETLRRTLTVPIVLMGYYNPILAFDTERFLRKASDVGVDGLIVPDLPVEEAAPLSLAARKHDVSLIFLAAPTSGKERIKKIDRLSDDFVYAVTVTGVTGSRSNISDDTDKYLRKLRGELTKPFVAGFGVSSPKTAARLAQIADGVVIGSALIELIRKAKSAREGVKLTARLLTSIRRALDSVK